MKSFLYKNLLFTIVYVGLFISCKKYPEDGKLPNQTVNKRLQHKWELKECKINGIESICNIMYYIDRSIPSGNLNDSVIYTLKNFILEFSYYSHKVYGQNETKNKVTWQITDYLFRLNQGILYEGSNEWNLESKKSKLKFKKDIRYELYFNYDDNKLRLLFNPSNETWNIRKLTDKELILETINSDNNNIRLKFNRL